MTAASRRSKLLLAPSAGLFGLLFVVPFLYFFLVSFWDFKFYKLIRVFQFTNYEIVFGQFLPVLLFTLAVAGAIALCSLVTGFVYAYIIRFKSGSFGPILLFIALVTLFGGYLMKIYAWRTILGNEGIINTVLTRLGLVSEPVSWLLYSPPAVVITLTHFLFPFSVLPIVASMRGIRDIEVEAAADLGASPWRIAIDQIIPRCRTGILAAFVIPFLIACGDWVTPVLVGGRMTLLGNLISSQFGDFTNWPLGAAMSFTLLAAAGCVIALFALLLRAFSPR
jgi:spermidine/putrescine transport system permease protein